MKLDFSSRFSLAAHVELHIRPVGAEFFHAEKGRTDLLMDGRADMTKTIVAFLNFANAPKNQGIAFQRPVLNRKFGRRWKKYFKEINGRNIH